ncbi:hypothetical protein ACFOY2_11020 [Nonomuraea purpurea]|uniref:DUF1648 domain-containing protein n=1 Tax=Nonomuraea purpurea TaxID=1849276 RepID=A0ABV8G191_9ACTN
MKPRVVAIGWGLAVTAVLLVPPLALRDRLPEPLATHWGPGSMPDRSMPFTSYLLMVVLLWAVPWLVMVAMAGRAIARRQGRMLWWGCLFALGVMLTGVNAQTLAANLDLSDWSGARLSGWQVVVMLLATLGAAVLAGYLGRGAPDEPPGQDLAPPRMRLRPGQRTVWVSHVVSVLAVVAALAGLAALAVTGALFLVGTVSGPLVTLLPGFVIITVVGLAGMSLTVTVSGDSLVIGFGPLGWPARRIPLSRIELAWAEERSPAQVGGWGLRGLPGSATIMLRGGECLVVRYHSGGQLAISIDDAERGASLINALITERAEL